MVEKTHLSFSSSRKEWPFRVLYRSVRPSTGGKKTGEGTFPFFLNLPTPFITPLSPLLSLTFYIFNISLLLLFSCVFFPFTYHLLPLLFGSMVKEKIRVSMDPAGEIAMERFRHQYLLQDYQQLVKEIKDKRERLQKVMQKKLKLMAEVKFLGKKFQSFTKTKKQSYKIASSSKQISQTNMFLKERNLKSKETSFQTARKLIDLNQVFLPNDEDVFEEGEEMKMEKLRRFEDAVCDDRKLSVCREIGTGSGRSGKRKITWQDQLALRV